MLTRRTVILAKREATYGTDPAMTGSDGIVAWDVDLTIDGEVLKRDVMRDTLSPLSHVIGLRESSLTFKTELKGAGISGTDTNLPQVDDLITACGFGTAVKSGTSQTYSLVSDEASISSVALKVYKDGNLHKLTGARGTVKFNLMAGKFGEMEWEFKGIWNSVIASTIPDIGGLPEASSLVPIVYNSSFQISGFSPVCSQLNIDLANEIARRDDLNAASGVQGFRLTGRVPKMDFMADAVVESSNSFWGDWASSVVGTFGILIGSNAGNKIGISGNWQTETNKYGDSDGISIYEVSASLVSSTDNDQNDELVLAFY